MSDRETIEEAIHNGRDAFLAWISAQADMGREIPRPSYRVPETEPPMSGKFVQRVRMKVDCPSIPGTLNKFGRKAFQQFIRDYAADGNLRGSLTKMTGLHLVTLEKEWLDYMEVRVSWIPLITSATTLWFVITLIFV